MGEILRAVLEESCQFSRPKFYGARLNIPATLQQGLTRSTVTTFDMFGWFLLTSFYVGGDSGVDLSTNNMGGLAAFAANIQLQDLQTGKVFYDSAPSHGGTPGLLVGSYSTSPTELPEYPLFGPGERIRLIYTYTGLLQTGGPFPDFVDICYSGIEYLMLSPGAANGAPPA